MGRSLSSSPGSSGALSGYLSILKRLPQYVGGLLLFLYALFFIYRAAIALFFPYPLDYVEGPVFYEAGQLFGKSFVPTGLYLTNSGPPYLSGIYTPLFYYLNAVMMFVTGPSSMLSGRLITVLASAYLAFRLFRIARKEEVTPGRRSRFSLSLAAAATPFATAALYNWGVLGQGSVLALCLGLSAVINVWQADTERRQKRGAGTYIFAGILCSLALLCQQTALAAPLAIFIWLAVGLRWRETGLFVVSFVGSFILVSLGFQLTSGDNYLRHVTALPGYSFDLGQVWSWFAYIFLAHIGLLILAGTWFLRPLIGRFERVDLWRIYFIFAMVFGLITGDVLEALCLMSLLAWWQIGRLLALRTEWRLFRWRPQVAPLALTLMALQLLYLWHIPGIAESSFTPGLDKFSQADQIAAEFKQVYSKGPMVVENSGWLSVVNVPSDLDDPLSFNHLAAKGAWSESLFLSRLSGGYYQTIVFEISQPDLSEAALEKAVNDNTAVPAEGHFDSDIVKLIKDRSQFTVLKRIGTWVFLARKS